MPSRDDSSRRSAIPVIVRALTSSAMRCSIDALFTMYGSSVTMMRARSLARSGSSMVQTARTLMDPRPVVYASMTPRVPRISPPVGKSGAGRCVMRSTAVSVGSSISATVASISSPRLCGGMFVAMPTAIPVEPFASRLGKRAGRTTGSSSYPS